MTQLLRKISNWYFSRKALPYWYILAMDCLAVYISGLFVYYFQFGGKELALHFWQGKPWTLFVSNSLYRIVFLLSHLSWRNALLQFC